MSAGGPPLYAIRKLLDVYAPSVSKLIAHCEQQAKDNLLQGMSDPRQRSGHFNIKRTFIVTLP